MQYTIKQSRINRITFQIYAYHDKKAPVRKFRTVEGKVITGCFTFANRVVASNKKSIHDQQGFNTPAAAKKNLLALKKSMVYYS